MGRDREKEKLWNAPGRPGTEVVSVSQPTGTVGGYSSGVGRWRCTRGCGDQRPTATSSSKKDTLGITKQGSEREDKGRMSRWWSTITI